MRSYLSALRKCFTENGFLLGLLITVSAGSLFLVFWKGWSTHPLAPISYAVSAYTLTASILWLVPRVPVWRTRAGQLPFVVRWKGDPKLQRRTYLYRSFSVGVLLVLYKASTGLYYRSAWFIAMAFYYAVLSLQRGLILRAELGKLRRMRDDTVLGLCGWLMFLLAMSVLGMRVLLFRDGERIAYPGHMIYAVALYAFYSLTAAILHTVRRKWTDPLQIAYRRVQLVSALVSILFLQAALLAAFSDDAAMSGIFNLATGGAVALITLVIGVHMIVVRPMPTEDPLP